MARAFKLNQTKQQIILLGSWYHSYLIYQALTIVKNKNADMAVFSIFIEN